MISLIIWMNRKIHLPFSYQMRHYRFSIYSKKFEESIRDLIYNFVIKNELLKLLSIVIERKQRFNQ